MFRTLCTFTILLFLVGVSAPASAQSLAHPWDALAPPTLGTQLDDSAVDRRIRNGRIGVAVSSTLAVAGAGLLTSGVITSACNDLGGPISCEDQRDARWLSMAIIGGTSMSAGVIGAIVSSVRLGKAKRIKKRRSVAAESPQLLIGPLSASMKVKF